MKLLITISLFLLASVAVYGWFFQQHNPPKQNNLQLKQELMLELEQNKTRLTKRENDKMMDELTHYFHLIIG